MTPSPHSFLPPLTLLQATQGDVKGDRPGAFDFIGASKYDAWVEYKGMDQVGVF